MLFLWYLHIQVTHVWWGETVGRERTSLMLLQLVSSPICNVILWYLHIQWTHVWWGPTVGSERTSLMLLQLVFSPICYAIFVIFTHTSDPRLMRTDCRQWKDVFNVVATCVQSHLLCYFCDIYTYKWPTFDEEGLFVDKPRERTSLLLL
jgi:hypothetical protein